MLSNETKLNRINSKLEQYGIQVDFACFDLKTYTPRLVIIPNKSFEYKIYELYGIKIGLKVTSRNMVKFAVVDILGVDGRNQSGDWFDLYVNWVKEIDSVINYCNNLCLEVPKYDKSIK